MERHRPEGQEVELTGPLHGRASRDAGRTHVTALAGLLLASLGAAPASDASASPELVLDANPDTDPVEDWAASGAMALTGEPDGAGRPVPGRVTDRLRAAALVVDVLSATLGHRVELDGPALLGERAAIARLTRQGTTSPGGSCRLLPARDGWVACNLARREDFMVLPALMECDVRGDPWDALAAWVSGVTCAHVLERGALLGLPVARVATPREATTADPVRGPWIVTPGAARKPRSRPLVIDLSALWAGPLCASILAAAGADVVKVESAQRPDGARRGPAPFFDLMNGGKRSACVDLGSDVFRALLERADVVVESSRPRVMENLGIDVDALVRDQGVSWVSITGYGRTGPERDRVAFGDDAAAAGGACALIGDAEGPPMICADAFADPVAGLHAAAAALACVVGSRGALVDVALRRVVSWVFADAGTNRAGRGRRGLTVVSPHARPVTRTAPALGADTTAVLAQLGLDPLE